MIDGEMKNELRVQAHAHYAIQCHCVCSDDAAAADKLAFKVPSEEAEQHCMPSEPGRKRKLLVSALFRLYTVLS